LRGAPPPWHSSGMRVRTALISAGMAAMSFLALMAAQAQATKHVRSQGDVFTLYSTLDESVAAPLIDAFLARNPGVSVDYHDLLAVEIAQRIVAETDAGGTTADFAFSSAMDEQIKLANDGYARAVDVVAADFWPEWAKWRETAFALTYEPAVIVWHKPSFPQGAPRSRLELLDWLKSAKGAGGIGTYDIERSSVGFLYLARDAEHFADVWSLIEAMAGAGLETYPTSRDIIERVATGELALGYNILGSYAMEQAARAPDLGVLLPADFTVVVSRVGLVPRAAARPDLGQRFLEFLMSKEGQSIMADTLHLAALSPQVEGGNTARAMEARIGAHMKPVPVSPGLLAYLDSANRARLVRKWRDALEAGP
jgi:iron(III) transport system substrate-binding protein